MSSPYSGYQQGSTYTAAADRAVQYSKMTHGLNGLIADDGVLLGGGPPDIYNDLLTVKTTGMGLSVKAGMAMVSGYTAIVPQAVALTLAASTTSARRDLVILRVYDTEAGDASNTTTVEIVKGTTTSDPAVPARSLVLAQCDIPASATSPTVVERRRFTVALGGVKPSYPSIASTDYTKIAPGQIVFDCSTGYYWRRGGGGWENIIDDRYPPSTPTGLRLESRHVVITTDGNGAAIIPFQQAFSAKPQITCTLSVYNPVPAAALMLYEPQIWPNQFTVLLYQISDGQPMPGSSSFDLYYTAVGPR